MLARMLDIELVPSDDFAARYMRVSPFGRSRENCRCLFVWPPAEEGEKGGRWERGGSSILLAAWGCRAFEGGKKI